MSKSQRKCIVLIVSMAAVAAPVVVHLLASRFRAGAVNMIVVHIPGPESSVQGVAIQGNAEIGSGTVYQPCIIKIIFSDGFSCSVVARSCTIGTSSGRSTDVYIRRPLNPMSFLAAKADLVKTLHSIGLPPDQQMSSDFAAWSTNAVGFGEVKGVQPYDYKTGRRVPIHAAWVQCRISPDPDGGWYYLIILGAADRR